MRTYDEAIDVVGNFAILPWRQTDQYGNLLLVRFHLAVEQPSDTFASLNQLSLIGEVPTRDFLREGAFEHYEPYALDELTKLALHVDGKQALFGYLDILLEMGRPWSAVLHNDFHRGLIWRFGFFSAADAVEFRLRCP